MPEQLVKCRTCNNWIHVIGTVGKCRIDGITAGGSLLRICLLFEQLEPAEAEHD